MCDLRLLCTLSADVFLRFVSSETVERVLSSCGTHFCDWHFPLLSSETIGTVVARDCSAAVSVLRLSLFRVAFPCFGCRPKLFCGCCVCRPKLFCGWYCLAAFTFSSGISLLRLSSETVLWLQLSCGGERFERLFCSAFVGIGCLWFAATLL